MAGQGFRQTPTQAGAKAAVSQEGAYEALSVLSRGKQLDRVGALLKEGSVYEAVRTIESFGIEQHEYNPVLIGAIRDLINEVSTSPASDKTYQLMLFANQAAWRFSLTASEAPEFKPQVSQIIEDSIVKGELGNAEDFGKTFRFTPEEFRAIVVKAIQRLADDVLRLEYASELMAKYGVTVEEVNASQ